MVGTAVQAALVSVHGQAWDRVATAVTGVIATGLEPVLPVECVVCREPGAALCRSCRRLLHRSTAHPARVEHYARHADGLPIVAAGTYEHELATCLLAMKQAGRTDLLPELGPVLLRAVRAALGTPGPVDDTAGPRRVDLVPIPTSARALRRRWFDPVGELLSAGRPGVNLPPGTSVTPWLVHRSRDPDGAIRELAQRLHLGPRAEAGAQKARSADARVRSGAQNFRVATGRRLPSGRRAQPGAVVLIDDVVTTGATLSRACRTLRDAGAEVLGAVVLAAAHTPTGNMPHGVGHEGL
ncbi:ComF family protein [Kocuria soli]|uniref:ComF family protein n=1 Tax=Kocuria soli TaxID=2485125 RepID=A0A3N3ZVX1_9MICC|nr:ComF family protein [Kocuria soli]